MRMHHALLQSFAAATHITTTRCAARGALLLTARPGLVCTAGNDDRALNSGDIRRPNDRALAARHVRIRAVHTSIACMNRVDIHRGANDELSFEAAYELVCAHRTELRLISHHRLRPSVTWQIATLQLQQQSMHTSFKAEVRSPVKATDCQTNTIIKPELNDRII